MPQRPYHRDDEAQVDEICQRYAVDGFWFDIFQVQHGCYCDRCRASMAEKGIDIDDEEAVVAHFAGVYKAHMEDMRATIAAHPPTQPCSSAGPGVWSGNQRYGAHVHNTHQDLEDLPTGWGGYDKFPPDRSITLAKATRSVR